MDWKGTIFPIVTLLLGSSVIITVFNGLYSGIVQPVINIKVDHQPFEFGRFGYSDNETPQSSITTSDNITITNYGRDEAKNIKISIYYPDSNIHFRLKSFCE